MPEAEAGWHALAAISRGTEASAAAISCRCFFFAFLQLLGFGSHLFPVFGKQHVFNT